MSFPGETQGEVGRVVAVYEEVVGETLEGAAPALRSLTDGEPKIERVNAGLDAHGEDFGEAGLDDVSGAVVDQLGDGAGSDGADVVGLVAYGV